MRADASLACPRRLSLACPTSEITLNTADPLVLLGVVLVLSAEPGKRLTPVDMRRNDDKELTTLVFGENVPAGEATLGLRWEGTLRAEGMLGQSAYRGRGPRRRWLTG